MNQHDTLTRFSRDMDGSMEPDENGSWVRFEDAQAALSATQPAQAAQSAPVGYAGYTLVQGFTAAFFPAEKIPEGTPLYIAPQPAAGADVNDTARLDALARPGWELSMNNEPECGPDELWQVHRVSGGRNDREWTLIGEGTNPRAAIDAAIAASGRQG